MNTHPWGRVNIKDASSRSGRDKNVTVPSCSVVVQHRRRGRVPRHEQWDVRRVSIAVAAAQQQQHCKGLPVSTVRCSHVCMRITGVEVVALISAAATATAR